MEKTTVFIYLYSLHLVSNLNYLSFQIGSADISDDRWRTCMQSRARQHPNEEEVHCL